MIDSVPQDLRAQLEPIVDGNFDRLIADTQKIIAFQTVSGGNEEQERLYREQIPACLEWLREIAETHGFAFRTFNGDSAEIEWTSAPEPGETRKVLGIASHIDVVSPNPVSNWTYPPFAGEIHDGVLFGRGIQDDKGPLMMSLYGMIAVKQAGIRPACDIRIIIGTREETGDWTDMAGYIRDRGAPDFSFTPDADFPVITGEKGMANLRIRAQWPETNGTPMEFVAFKGGERNNIVPALAEARFRYPADKQTEIMKEMMRETTAFTAENRGAQVTILPDEARPASDAAEAVVSFIGKAAHSSLPQKGHNAIVDAITFFSDIETLPPPVRAYIQFLTFIGADHTGATYQIDSYHDFVGETTSVLSLVNVTPTGGTATLNVRPTMGMPVATVMAKAREAAQTFSEMSGLDIAIEQDGRVLDAIFLDPALPGIGNFLSSLQAAYETVTGAEGHPLAVGGTTYSKAIPNCCAFGPCMPGVDDELAHQADERLAVDSIRRNALIYALSIALVGSGG